jgi:hypothetical protein
MNVEGITLLLSGYSTDGFALLTLASKLSMNQQHRKMTSRKQRLPLKLPTSYSTWQTTEQMLP